MFVKSGTDFYEKDKKEIIRRKKECELKFKKKKHTIKNKKKPG